VTLRVGTSTTVVVVAATALAGDNASTRIAYHPGTLPNAVVTRIPSMPGAFDFFEPCRQGSDGEWPGQNMIELSCGPAMYWAAQW